jgi:hypothetical protein
VRAGVIMAFVNGLFRVLFPGKQRSEAIGTKIFCGFTKAPMKLKDIATYFTFKL